MNTGSDTSITESSEGNFVEKKDEFEETDSTDEESGRFVRRMQTSSEDEANLTDAEQISDHSAARGLKKRYNSLLAKFKNSRKRKVKRSKPGNTEESSSKSLADKIRGWQMMELERLDDHKEQYHSWLAFKSTVEANWQMYDIKKESDKLICLRTKCKGFIVELINSLQRAKAEFQEVWDGLQTQFYAPIDSGEETAVFYQTKQRCDENIFNFFQRISKQASLCDFAESEYYKRIGETFCRNCLNPAYFLGKFDKFDDLDKLKHHSRNFHAALPKLKAEPVLAIKHTHSNAPREYSSGFKRRSENNVDDFRKRRRFDESRDQRKPQFSNSCKYCGENNCNFRHCPARGKRCSYCQRFDHFEKACLRKRSDNMNKYNNSVNAVKNEDDQKVNSDEN